MLCSVVFATSRLKAELVGPRKEGCFGVARNLLEGDIGGGSVMELSDGGTNDIPSPPARSALRFAYRLSTCSCSWARWAFICRNSSDSLKPLVQQFGAYWQSRLRLPHRWQGVLPLHLIFRRLHSLLNTPGQYLMLSLLACCIGCAATFKPAIQPKQKNVPRNGDISIPLRPSMCNPICTSANFVILSLVSAPIACFRRAFRTRRLALAVHVARNCGGRDRCNG